MVKIKELLKKYRELITYVIVGGMTTVVNFVVYRVDMIFNMNMTLNLIISWVAAVLFAYFANKIIVFKSKENDVLTELLKFVSSRIASLIIEIVLMWVCVELFNWGEWIAKFPVAIFVVIINYIFSKLWVFTKKAE